ncbi:Predicted enzyme of the cupin superfamily, partial [Pseudomonas sp. FEN]
EHPGHRRFQRRQYLAGTLPSGTGESAQGRPRADDLQPLWQSLRADECRRLGRCGGPVDGELYRARVLRNRPGRLGAARQRGQRQDLARRRSLRNSGGLQGHLGSAGALPQDLRGVRAEGL